MFCAYPLALGLALLGCTQIDGSPPCYAPEILHYCEGLCTAKTCTDFSFQERHVDAFVCAERNDQIKLRHRFFLQVVRRGYGVGDCGDPTCYPSVDEGGGMLPPGGAYNEQAESEAVGTSGDWQPLPEGDCVP